MKRVVTNSAANSEIDRYIRMFNLVLNSIDSELINSASQSIKRIDPDSVRYVIQSNFPRRSIKACYAYAAHAYALLALNGYDPQVVIGAAYDTDNPLLRGIPDFPNHVWIVCNGMIFENFEGIRNKINHRKELIVLKAN